MDIVKEDQEEVNELKAQSDKLKAECDDKASANNFFESRL